MKTNEYTIAFPFRGIYMEVKVDANYLANRFITMDSDYDFPYDEEINVFPTFTLFDDTLKQYIDIKNPKRTFKILVAIETNDVTYPCM